MNKQEAQAAYLQAWRQRCLATSLNAQKAAERVMDAVQSACVDGGRPGPEWRAFIETLPGYVEFWNRLYVETQQRIGRD